MGKSIGSFVALNRRAFLVLGVVLSLAVFGIVTWRISAQTKDKGGSQDPPSIDGDKIVPGQEEFNDGFDVITAPVSKTRAARAATPLRPEAGTDQGEEKEPNDSIATATALTGAEGRIKGYCIPGTPDVDYYSFTANAGDRVYAGVMTSFSPGSVDSILELRNAADVALEQDLNDGSFGSTSSGIAGAVIPSAGTYYLRVRENATSTIRPYYLYYAVRSGSPTAEVESNNTTATANALPGSGWVSGTRDPASDADFFSMTLNAGDTVFISADLDPERDNVQWNGRIGMALFGTGSTQILVIDDASVGSATNPLSESFYMTVRDAGTYYAYIDSATAATASPTFTYNMSVTVIPAPSSANCTTYTNSTPTPIADLALSSSTITVPATANRIRDINLYLNGTHTFVSDMDVHLRSPSGNDNGVFTDVGPATVGGAQTTFNWWFDDEAGIPPSFAVSDGMRHTPESAYRLDWFDGEDATGIWTLDIRDDASGDVGTLNSWSLEVCTEPTPAASQVVYSENFDGGGGTDGGFTHSGTLDEWQRGTPATVATSVSPARAAFLNCSSGTNCWKTDLTGTYELGSSQDLVSPSIPIPAGSTNVIASWAMRYQMENATFDHAFVEVREVGNPANSKTLWTWTGATMSEGVGNPAVQIGESAGWGIYHGDISSFAGLNVEYRFHVDGDAASINYPGMAVDDVLVTRAGAAQADLAVTKSDSPDPVVAGQDIIYTINLTNNGPNDAQTVTLTDLIPANTTPVFLAQNTGPAFTTGFNGTAFTATIPAFAAGASASFSMEVTVNPGTAGGTVITNTVTVASTTTDPTPGNNSSTATTTVLPPALANLGITKTDGVTTVVPGGTTTYTITASNAGPDPVVGATVTDNFPATITSVNWTCTASAGSSCPANGTGNISASVNLLVGGTATFTAITTISPTATFGMNNVATITAPLGTIDPVLTNNRANDVDNICPVSNVIFAYNLANNHLVSFDAATPGTLATDVAITGLNAGETLIGLDFRPANGTLYSVAATAIASRVVTINTATGAVTGVGAGFTPALAGGQFYGIDFNPTVDRIRVVNTSDLNIRLNPNDGTLVGTDTNLAYIAGDPNLGANPTVAQIAYSNNTAGASTTTLFAIDTNVNTLDRIGGVNGSISPNTGQLTTIGSLGVVTTSNSGGFDIQSGTGTAYAVLTVSNVSNLYTINLATGAATLVGGVGPVGAGTFINGIALAPPVCSGPTRTGVTVSGRVLTPDGRGLRNAKVVLTDSFGIARTVTTSSFGYYQFDGIEAGESYVIGVASKIYRFQAQLVQVNDTLTDVNFIGQE